MFTPRRLSTLHFNAIDVYSVLHSLKPSLSTGSDGIPNIILKNCAVSLASPLASIFEISLRSHTLPKEWLSANVRPIFKNKGVADKIENYRPISLTSTSCTVMEKIIKKHISYFLCQNNLLVSQQHGFMEHKSTCSQLIECFCDWIDAIENQNSIDVIYIDFAKAFDTIGHNKLAFKLEKYGITGYFEMDNIIFIQQNSTCCN